MEPLLLLLIFGAFALNKGRHLRLKPLLAFAVLSLLALGATACSGSGKSTSSAPNASASRVVPNIVTPSSMSATFPATYFMGDIDDEEEHSSGSPAGDTDADSDNDVKEHQFFHDRDDKIVLAHGHAASAADYGVLTDFVKRYYKVAAAGDGATACSTIAPAFEKRIPREFGSTAGPSYMRGKTCPEVMSLFFKHEHQNLTTVSTVTGARVKGNQAFVLLGSKTLPASYIELVREGNTWRSMDLLATPLP
jgi:hypothetical protein